MPKLNSVAKLLQNGFQACKKKTSDGKETIHILPARYREVHVNVAEILNAAKRTFEEPGMTFETDIFGYLHPKAPKFLTPLQGMPFDTKQLSAVVGKHLFGVVPTFNNLERRGDKTETGLPFTQIMESAVSLIEYDSSKTLTLVVPANSHLVQPETFLRTEQRIWKEKVIPFLKGVGILTGQMYVQSCALGPKSLLETQNAEVSDKKWLALFLQGPRARVTAEHRQEIATKICTFAGGLPAPAGTAQMVTVAAEPKTFVTIEAGGPYWGSTPRHELWELVRENLELPDDSKLDEHPSYGGYASRRDCTRWQI
eukprot:gene4197-3880_t